LRRDFPALRSLEATPNNLPQQVSSLIGRESVLGEVRTLLGNTRLLTLVGVGGLGKTRTSLQVGADLLDDFPQGVWFVQLAPLSDARSVPEAVASVLGVKEEAGRPVEEALIRHVRGKRLLLIFDNCEHLVQACAELGKTLLEAGSQVKVLATSREPLRVGGETTYPLPALNVANPHQALTMDTLMRCEAVYLFVHRAVAVQPSFRLTPANAPAVTAVCHALDGIPLAIELAAARVRALSVEKVAERLSDRFRLLTGGDRTTLPRQQTLRACIDWSHNLLAERERVLLRRLAVFAGGWTLEAAEAVGSGGDIVTSDVLDLLTGLVEKSLVESEAAVKRYRLLETVRQYAQEQLDASGEGDATRSRHGAFYLVLALEAKPMLVGPEQGAWLARVDLERDNFLSAFAWFDRVEGDGVTGLKLVDALAMYWFCRGLNALGHRLMVQALAHPASKHPTADRCAVVISAGQLCAAMGRHEETRLYGEEALQFPVTLGNENLVDAAHRLLGGALLEQGDLDAARGHFEEALRLARESRASRRISMSLSLLGALHRDEADLVAAGSCYEQSLALSRERGARADIALDLCSLAITLIGRKSVDSVFPLLREALSIAWDIGDQGGGNHGLFVAAGLGSVVGEWDYATRLHAAAEVHLGQTGLQRERIDEAFIRPLIAEAREALGEPAFADAARGGRAMSYEKAMSEAREWLDQR
jgi:predicted ATPase